MKLTKNNVLVFPTLEEIIREGLGLKEKDDWLECWDPDKMWVVNEVIHLFTPDSIVELLDLMNVYYFEDVDLPEEEQTYRFLDACRYILHEIEHCGRNIPFGRTIAIELLRDAINNKSGITTSDKETDPIGYVKIAMGKLYFQRNYEIERVVLKMVKNMDQRFLNTLYHEYGTQEFSEFFEGTTCHEILSVLFSKFDMELSYLEDTLGRLSSDTIEDFFKKEMFETDVSELSVKEQLNKAEYPILYTLIMRNE